MASEKLRERMNDDVGTVFDRPNEIGARHCVVDDQRQPMPVRHLCNGRDIDKCAPGLARLSMKIAFVFPSIWASKFAGSAASAQRTCQPKFWKEWPNWLIEPP